jgi:membrane-associated phospholipid phosphatase
MTQLLDPPVAERELIPRSLRPAATVVVAVCVATLVGLSVWLANTSGPTSVELPLVHLQYPRDGVPLVWEVGVAFGSAVFVWFGIAAMILWGVLQRQWARAAAVLAVPGTVWMVENVLKPLIDRETVGWRPTPCFPSGTAAGVVALLTVFWVLALPYARSKSARLVLVCGCAALVLYNGLAIVLSGRHYPLDVVGGVAVGLPAVLLWCRFLDRLTAPELVLNPD